MQQSNAIRVYGAERCHKTQFYLDYLRSRNEDFDFLDVEKNNEFAAELRMFYDSGKLNFPTLIVAGKKLRNPRIEVLDKWIDKLR